MDIHWIIFGASHNNKIESYYMNLIKDGRRARFYNWYNRPALRGRVSNEDTNRMWIMVF
jgi:hypothetical protein